MRTKPSTNELATLALKMCPTKSLHSGELLDDNLYDSRFKEAVRLSIMLWNNADAALESVDRAQAIIGRLKSGILTLSPEEWDQIAAEYPLSKDDIDTAIFNTKFETAAVKLKLYRDKSLTRAQRDMLFSSLLKYAVDHEIFFPGESVWSRNLKDSMNDALTVSATLSGWEARWAYLVRRHQNAANKSRIVPQSLRRRRRFQE